MRELVKVLVRYMGLAVNSSYGRYYLFGVAINLLYLATLFIFPVSRHNLYPLSDSGVATVWAKSDAGTYIRSANAFLETGIFADSDGLPDAHRTVGYPAFIALTMAIGRDHWEELLWVLQALLFAAIYPALAVVSREWFGSSKRQIDGLLLLYVLLGAGWAYTPIPLTDQMFVVFLWTSLAFGTLGICRGGRNWVFHFLLLAAAASIRPTLALFPFAFIAVTLAIRRCRYGSVKWGMLSSVFIIQMLLCQTPAIRNYLHHGVWIPSDVAINNLSDYWAKDVLAWSGKVGLHAEAEAEWAELLLRDRLPAQGAFSRSVLVSHPFMAIGVVMVNFGMNTLETHWIQTMHFFRSSLHCDLKRWTALSLSQKAFHAAWACIHGFLSLAACAGLWRMIRQDRAWLMFAVFFVLPYIYCATDAQGARFRLYLEGMILMLAFQVFQPLRGKYTDVCR